MTKTIAIATPAPPGSRNGNRATATRWATLLEQAGFSVSVTTHDPDPSADLLIALHAWRSAEVIARWRARRKPLIVVLTGTDIYKFQFSHADIFSRSLEAADQLVGLHEHVHRNIPPIFHSKLNIVLQSAQPSARHDPTVPSREICVVGHLREEKDPFRILYALDLLGNPSPWRVLSFGKAHAPEWAAEAQRMMEKYPTYEWLGERPREEVQCHIARCAFMVISSIMEGGANVVSEACRMGLPVLASDIPGNVGLLGANYPGYFATGNAQALAELILRCQNEPSFLKQLAEAVVEISEKFTPEKEKEALLRVIEKVQKPGK